VSTTGIHTHSRTVLQRTPGANSCCSHKVGVLWHRGGKGQAATKQTKQTKLPRVYLRVQVEMVQRRGSPWSHPEVEADDQ
jgi:hypothetical protein